MIYNVIQIRNIKCAECGEFNSTHQIVIAKLRQPKDDVKYRLLCNECAKNEILLLEAESMQ